MTNVMDVRTWFDLAPVLVWTIVVYGTAVIVFRSWPAAKLAARIQRSRAPRVAAAQRAGWELTHGVVWAPEVAADVEAARRTGDGARAVRAALENSGAVRLTDVDVAERRRIADPAAVDAWYTSAAMWLLSCTLCQGIWCAAMWYCIAHDLTWPAGMVPSVIVYAVLAAVLTRVIDRIGSAAATAPQGGCGSAPPMRRR